MEVQIPPESTLESVSEAEPIAAEDIQKTFGSSSIGMLHMTTSLSYAGFRHH